MKNLFTFIVALFMATSVYAQTMWKATADVNPIPANTELINDGGLVVKTVFGNTLAALENATIEGETFSAYFQVRTKTDPTEDNPECTEESGKQSTSLIVEVTGKTTFTIYGRRQVVGDNCVNNDGKDLLMVNQNNVKVLLTPTDYSWTLMPNSTQYAYYKKTYTLNPGTYTIFRRGSTMKIYGIQYAFESESSSVTITDAGFATHASKFAVDYSNRTDGLEAYAVKYTNGTLTYNKIDGIVPANTAVLLKGEAKEYTLTAAKGEATTVDTDLKVANGEKKGDGNIYCLANKASNGVGFYQVSSSVTIPKNKAYLEIGTPVTTPAKYYSIGIGGNTTGIQTIQQNGVKADGIMYSLSGQKVGANYKGIVICNGKKMIKK